MPKFIDLTGQRFGLLVVISRGENCSKWGTVRWICSCDCGREALVFGSCLRGGTALSCGCEVLLKNGKKSHNLSLTTERRLYGGMLARCRNPNVRSYHRYGGSGVAVCQRWIDGEGEKIGFECFLEDMGKRPSPSHSLDRFPNNSGNYEPGNVRWATAIQQTNNRKNTRHIKFQGQKMPLTDAVRLTGSVVHHETAWTRIKRGWPVERAITTPRLFERHNSGDDP